jgi:hypothetical protein
MNRESKISKEPSKKKDTIFYRLGGGGDGNKRGKIGLINWA